MIKFLSLLYLFGVLSLCYSEEIKTTHITRCQEEQKAWTRKEILFGDSRPCNVLIHGSFPAIEFDFPYLLLYKYNNLMELKINGHLIQIPPHSKRTESGTIVPLTGIPLNLKNNKIEARFSNDDASSFIGFWKTLPVITTLNEANSMENRYNFFLNSLPRISGIILMILAVYLAASFFALKTEISNLYLSVALSTWSIFFFFLSGDMREINFHFGTLLHYPVRTLAAFSFGIIILKTLPTKPFFKKHYSALFILIFLIQMFLDIRSNHIGSRTLYFPAIILGVTPLMWVSREKLDTQQKLFFFGMCLIGLINIIDGINYSFFIFNNKSPIPYLNRYVYPPLTMLILYALFLNQKETYTKLKNRVFAKQIYHDLKSPLAALEIATHRLEESDSKNILKLVNDRIQSISKGLVEGNENSPLKHTYQQLALSLEQTIKEKELEFSGSPSISLHIEEAKAEKFYMNYCEVELQRIISNLINNSRNASDPNQSIEVSLTLNERKNKATLEIKDHGRGIPEGSIPKILKTGYTSNPMKGMGLGLSHAAQKARDWNAALDIYSKVGSGTSISLTFRITERA